MKGEQYESQWAIYTHIHVNSNVMSVLTSGGRAPARSNRISCNGSSAGGDSGCRCRSTSSPLLLNRSTIISNRLDSALGKDDLQEKLSAVRWAKAAAEGMSASR